MIQCHLGVRKHNTPLLSEYNQPIPKQMQVNGCKLAVQQYGPLLISEDIYVNMREQEKNLRLSE